jgi:hypothetical protein
MVVMERLYDRVTDGDMEYAEFEAMCRVGIRQQIIARKRLHPRRDRFTCAQKAYMRQLCHTSRMCQMYMNRLVHVLCMMSTEGGLITTRRISTFYKNDRYRRGCVQTRTV